MCYLDRFISVSTPAAIESLYIPDFSQVSEVFLRQFAPEFRNVPWGKRAGHCLFKLIWIFMLKLEVDLKIN
jgi:hypothetical protein